MEGFGCIRTEGENRPSRPGHIVVGCDLYNQVLTGDTACALTASMEVAGHSGPKVLILNDQGGSVMDVSQDVTATLRAQDHGHPPVICLNFQGSKSNNAITEDGKCYSLNAMHGHDMHVICIPMTFQGKAGSEASLCVGENIAHTLRPSIEADVVYCFEPGIMSRDCSAGNRAYKNICSTLRAQMGDNQPAVCYEENNECRRMP